MALEISATLDDKYEILKRLATGGMGDVYLVRHRHLHEQRVVKVLRADLAADADAMQRFQGEARMATQIKHPNVAILYDYSRLPDGRYYMVWEFIEGEDLASRIRKGPIPPDQAVEYAIQALRGLDAVHSAGIIHRDISPDNLMVTRDLRGRALLKIIDLGLAKDLRPGAEMELTQAGAFLGKFQYCSPEQAGYLKDAPLDARSDLYSLAQVLYEMLTGMSPFDSESQHGFVLKRLTEEPLQLRTRNPRVQLPLVLEAVVMRGLQRDRDKRYPDATNFIQALVKVSQALREVSTQELSAAAVQAALAAMPPSSTTKTKLPLAKSVSPIGPASAKSTDLSRQEKEALLARIDKAATKAQEGGTQLSQADAALKEGRFEEARQLIKKLEALTPAPRGLAELRKRLAEAEEIARRRQQVLQAEQMLEKYLLDRQQTLASLALETLLDLYPNHPRKNDYEAMLANLASEAEISKRAERACAEGRAAVARGDLQTARIQLEEVERYDKTGKLTGALLSDITEAERNRQQGQRAQSVRERLEDALRKGQVEEANRQLDVLSSLEVTKVTLGMLRGQVEEAKQRQHQEERASTLEHMFRDSLQRHDWIAAREAAHQIEDAIPGSPRPRQMLAEIARLQEIEQRQQALVEGLRAFDGYLQLGQFAQAEVALRVLKNLGGADDARVVDAQRRLARAKG